LTGTDGAAAGSEHALTAALSSIDAIYGIEAGHDASQDVAAPVDIRRFWDAHGQLPCLPSPSVVETVRPVGRCSASEDLVRKLARSPDGWRGQARVQ
jgi:hypothetical protein